ncbi:MAG: gamma-glutamyl-gamma-aminobutyrate hydrolase family protein [Pseudomonadota bacterium]|nr:gamma-glutamyl-gamma-aminobutyrate hydrolase family protein [Pseudomonadota bacterium]
MKHKPIVLVPACHRMLGDHPHHTVGKKYTDAVRLAGCLPLLFTTIDGPDELDGLLDIADGVLLTGSSSNVHPSHFGEPVHDTSLPLDTARDAATLALIPEVIARGIPLMAICRGFQEVNVALGGSLFQAVHEIDGYLDHRGAASGSPSVVYGPAHQVELEANGFLAGLFQRATIEVNSVHGQGVRRLASALRVEARAPDGLIEAFSSAQPTGFVLGLQWHPEWEAHLNPVSTRLFEAFGLACGNFRDRHRGPDGTH